MQIASVETYTLPHIKYIASGELLFNTESPTPAQLCDNLEGWVRGVGGRLAREEICVYLWLIHFVYGRKQHTIVEQLSYN